MNIFKFNCKAKGMALHKQNTHKKSLVWYYNYRQYKAKSLHLRKHSHRLRELISYRGL